jgi:hypothetical protein
LFLINEETQKFVSEQHKLIAMLREAAKLERYMPWTVAATMMGTGAALFAAGAAFVKLLG